MMAVPVDEQDIADYINGTINGEEIGEDDPCDGCDGRDCDGCTFEYVRELA